jgi:hypothetical protein
MTYINTPLKIRCAVIFAQAGIDKQEAKLLKWDSRLQRDDAASG